MTERDYLEQLAVVLVGWHLCLALILVTAVVSQSIGVLTACLVAMTSAGISIFVVHRTWR